MKDQSTVIEEFNELVNMKASELESWLKSDDSQSAGWPKDGADGESVGHDSGGKIIEILKTNPGKDADKYTDDQIQHMRKVVSYCKRHLAQEEKGNSEKSTEEVKKTKSYASLKNWGHDILKKNGKKGNSKSGDKDDGEKQVGDKRKAPEDDSGSSKKREVEKGKKVEEEEDGEEDNETNGTGSNGGGKKQKSGGEKGKEDNEDSGKPTKGPEVGETVSWNWGNGQPEGKVLDVKDDKTKIKTKKGNEVSRKGNPEDPAVVVDAGKSKAIKLAHELN